MNKRESSIERNPVRWIKGLERDGGVSGAQYQVRTRVNGATHDHERR
jgi:hypothetical protein